MRGRLTNATLFASCKPDSAWRDRDARTLGAGRAGFTLLELLVVIGIIVLIAAAAMPAFRFITGSRSVDGATNIVNSMVARSRTQAVVDFRTAGVFFYLDPATDRTTMAMVEQSGDNFRDPDFYEYKGWTDGSDQQADSSYGANIVGTPTGQVVYYDATQTANGPSYAMALIQTNAAIISSTDPVEWFNYSERIRNRLQYPSGMTLSGQTETFQKLTNLRFRCSAMHNATGNSNDPPSTNGAMYWDGLPPTDLEIVTGTDVQALPSGVGLQVINDTKGLPNTDRYLRYGVVLFDDEGKFQSIPWTMKNTSKLSRLIFPSLSGTGGVTVTVDSNGNTLYSGVGVALYDRAVFTALGFTEGDYIYRSIGGPPSWLPSPSTFAAEQPEETWLDNNSLPLVVNRFNGALTKGE